MIYTSTVNNLVLLLRTVGVLDRGQIKKFFADTSDAINLDYYIEELAREHIVFLSKNNDRISYRKFPEVRPSIEDERIRAFWMIAAMGCNKVREIQLMDYPSQYLFITHDNCVYDVTVCESSVTAQMALQARKKYTVDTINDEVNHIALVKSTEFGQKLGPYGFDS